MQEEEVDSESSISSTEFQPQHKELKQEREISFTWYHPNGTWEHLTLYPTFDEFWDLFVSYLDIKFKCVRFEFDRQLCLLTDENFALLSNTNARLTTFLESDGHSRSNRTQNFYSKYITILCKRLSELQATKITIQNQKYKNVSEELSLNDFNTESTTTTTTSYTNSSESDIEEHKYDECEQLDSNLNVCEAVRSIPTKNGVFENIFAPVLFSTIGYPLFSGFCLNNSEFEICVLDFVLEMRYQDVKLLIQFLERLKTDYVNLLYDTLLLVLDQKYQMLCIFVFLGKKELLDAKFDNFLQLYGNLAMITNILDETKNSIDQLENMVKRIEECRFLLTRSTEWNEELRKTILKLCVGFKTIDTIDKNNEFLTINLKQYTDMTTNQNKISSNFELQHSFVDIPCNINTEENFFQLLEFAKWFIETNTVTFTQVNHFNRNTECTKEKEDKSEEEKEDLRFLKVVKDKFPKNMCNLLTLWWKETILNKEKEHN